MVDLLQQLFGGGQSNTQSSSNQVAQSTGASTQSSTQADVNPFAGLRDMFASQLTGGLPRYSGPLTTGMSGNEGNLLGSLMSQSAQGNDRFNLTSDTLRGNFLPGQPGANPFLDSAITSAQRGTMRNLEETLGRVLPGRFGAAGHLVTPGGSSAFDRAGAIATEGAAREMGDIATRMSSDAYEAERGRQQQAIPIAQQEVQTTIQNLQAQALPRMIQEMGVERGIQTFQQQTQQLLNLLQLLGGVTAPTLATTATGESAQDSQSVGNTLATGVSNTQQGIIPGIASLFGGGGSSTGGNPMRNILGMMS